MKRVLIIATVLLSALTLLAAMIWGGPKKPEPEPEPPLTGKPVIYLYPTEPTVVDVTLETIGARFTKTEPEYDNGWRVLAHPDGKLINMADRKEYPYLFWEAVNDDWPPFSDGFLVARENLEEFLREKLSFLGLLPVEYEEFLDYWVPALESNEYTIVHFSEEEYQNRYPMTVTPQPDSILRVHTVFKAAAGDERIAPQTLKPFDRKGFAVVEWGGTVVY